MSGTNKKGVMWQFFLNRNCYITLAFQKPLDLILPEGGGLTLATAAFLKDMHSVGKNGVLNPGHLFGQVSDGFILLSSMQIAFFVYM